MIQVSHLTKYYGDFLAVNDLSFEIQVGHVYGFLGPNGAGKSTTMNNYDCSPKLQAFWLLCVPEQHRMFPDPPEVRAYFQQKSSCFPVVQ